jgi:cytochrome c556
MKRFVQTGILAFGMGLVVAAGTVSVFAQQADKAAAVKARQDFMEDQQHAVNAVNAFAKGTGDRQGAIDGVNKLLDLSTQMSAKFDVLFVPGTSSTDVEKSKAKPELWQHIDELKAAPAKLHTAELTLVDVVKTGDPATVGTAMRNVYTQSCNALCHDSYRIAEKH